MRSRRGFWAAGWLVLLAGCASTDGVGFFGFQASGDDRVVTGSLDVVAKSTHARLERLGLKAVVTPQGEAIEIASAVGPDGKGRFKLVLTRDGERTRMKLVWIDERNDGFGQMVLKMIVE